MCLGESLLLEYLGYELDQASPDILSTVFAMLSVKVVRLNRCASGFLKSRNTLINSSNSGVTIVEYYAEVYIIGSSTIGFNVVVDLI